MGLPAAIAVVAAFLRWSPLMLPNLIFGDKYRLMEMEREGSLQYWSILVLDWAIVTGASFGGYSLSLTCADAMLRISLACKILR